MAVTTIQSSVNIAKDLKNKASSSGYIVVGKTSEWSNEAHPPKPSEDVTSIEEVIGYKKLDTTNLVRPLEENEQTNYSTIEFDGITWAIIPDDKAVDEKATFVYFEVAVNSSDFSGQAYRQVGLHTGLTTSSTSRTLSPSQVTDEGILEFYENRAPIIREDGTRVVERFIISTKVDQ